jgi:hypothetical protein
MMALLIGLLADALHVLAGPGHLVALAPIAADKPRRALSFGLHWGLGYGLGIWSARRRAGLAGFTSASSASVIALGLVWVAQAPNF